MGRLLAHNTRSIKRLRSKVIQKQVEENPTEDSDSCIVHRVTIVSPLTLLH